jgi:hypothetical protein
MLLQFMARTGAQRKREGEHRPPGDPQDRWPGARTQNFSASQGGEPNLEHPVRGFTAPAALHESEKTHGNDTPSARAFPRGAQPYPWSGLKNPGRGPEADGIELADPQIFSKAGRLSATQFTNRRSRTLFTSPSIKNIATIFDPPELISGSGMPVTGIRPTTIPTFTKT